MSKRKNKSFVKINENKKIKEEILNPLKQYDYIEPPKKFPVKKLILALFTIILIVLIILLSQIISKEIKKEKQNIQNTTTTNNFFTMKNTTTTTTETTTTTIDTNEVNNNEITETLVCSKTTEKDGLIYVESITTEFNNKKLRNDITSINIKQINENSSQNFKDQILLYEIMTSYLEDVDNCEVTNKITDTEYQLNIKTLYKENEQVNGLFSYNYDYDKTLSELQSLGYKCK